MNHHSKSIKKRKIKNKTDQTIIRDYSDPAPKELSKLLWAEIEENLRQYMKSLIRQMLDLELAAHLGANHYERSPQRTGYRNGSYERSLGTLYGTLENIPVPRLRQDTPEYRLFDRYQRRAGSLDQAIGALFLNGVSVRKLRWVAKEFLGTDVSASTISKVSAALSQEDLKQFQDKELFDQYEFLFLDGISSKVREIGAERKIMLCALGLKNNGTKEIIGARLADGEKEIDWQAFLMDLKQRGLLGKNIKLIVIDGNPGLKAALKSIYPFKPIQRCIAHKLRNAAVKIKRANQPLCLKGAKLVFAAQSRTEAVKRFRIWKTQWIVREERAINCLEKDLNECLNYLKFEKSLWKKIRTTNIIERSFREIRRRTRPMSIALPQESTERLFASLAKGLNNNWKNAVSPLK